MVSRWFKAAGLTLVCATLAHGPAPASEPVSLVLAHGATEQSMPHGLLLKPWAQRTEVLSGGKLRIMIEAASPRAQGGARAFERLAEGEVDLLWAPVSGQEPGLGHARVFELPFMAWPSEATSQALMALHRSFGDGAESDFKVILLHADAPLWLHMARRPVRSLEDLGGQRIYAPTPALRAFLRAAGAEPVVVQEPAGVHTLLARGDLDGAAMSFAAARPAGVLESTRYHTRIDRPPDDTRPRRPGLGTMVFVLAMNARRFQSLPEALRRLIRDSADPPMAESVGRAWDSVDRLNRRQARAEGHVFHQLTEAEWTRWRGAAQAVIDDWRQSTEGPALLDSARALTAEFNVLMAEEIGARTRPSRDKGG